MAKSPKAFKAVLYGEELPKILYCSFCAKSQHEVAKLIAGPGLIFICNACVALCDEIVAGGVPDSSGFPAPKDLPTERLIAQLPGVEATVRGKRTQLQWIIDELRRRELSWADIGEALGISRQAAWERFS